MITAKDLYDRGYCAEDRDELQKEFDLNGDALDRICEELAAFDRKRNIKEIYDNNKHCCVITASDMEQIGKIVRERNGGNLDITDLAAISFIVGSGIGKENPQKEGRK